MIKKQARDHNNIEQAEARTSDRTSRGSPPNVVPFPTQSCSILRHVHRPGYMHACTYARAVARAPTHARTNALPDTHEPPFLRIRTRPETAAKRVLCTNRMNPKPTRTGARTCWRARTHVHRLARRVDAWVCIRICAGFGTACPMAGPTSMPGLTHIFAGTRQCSSAPGLARPHPGLRPHLRRDSRVLTSAPITERNDHMQCNCCAYAR